MSTWCALGCGATTRSEAARGDVGGGGAASGEATLAAGRANSHGGAGSPSALEPALDVSGRWAQFGTDDAVAAELVQTTGVLTGNGCVVGLPTLDEPPGPFYCAPVRGQIQGARVMFAYDPSDLPAEGTDLWLSGDGQRMAGRHFFNGFWFAPTSWLRIGANDHHLPLPPELEPVARALESRNGFWYLTQLGGPAPVFLERPDEGVVLSIRNRPIGSFVFGTLGAFWHGEMRWNGDDSILDVGPVPETVPGLPIRLKLHFGVSTLDLVEATLASGELQRFSARARTVQ